MVHELRGMEGEWFASEREINARPLWPSIRVIVLATMGSGGQMNTREIFHRRVSGVLSSQVLEVDSW